MRRNEYGSGGGVALDLGAGSEAEGARLQRKRRGLIPHRQCEVVLGRQIRHVCDNVM